MKNLVLFLLFTSISIFSQNNLKQLLKKYNTESIPYISVNELSKLMKKPLKEVYTKQNPNNQTNKKVILLDAREPKEFKISHLQNAICVGYDNFNIYKTIQKLPTHKNVKIVVYCSLGIRSEDIAEQLKKVGYTNIFNLYGGIFEWKNKNNIVVNCNNKPTKKVHTFNKDWSKWLLKGKKIYE